MTSEDKQRGFPTNYKDIGILFISPIIGLPPSLIAAFDVLKKQGVKIDGVDIFEGQNIKKNAWKILGLTVFPGSHKRRIQFANQYDERRLFEIITGKIDKLKAQGITKIILGGMSGGFIFAARMAHIPPDSEIAPYALRCQPFIKGLFGISPLILYPADVMRKGSDLGLIPFHIPTLLIWGDADTIVPEGTIAHSQKHAEKSKHIKCLVIKGSDVGRKNGSIKHQFFGGKDFVKPLTNIYWNASAEKKALEEIGNMIKMIR